MALAAGLNDRFRENHQNDVCDYHPPAFFCVGAKRGLLSSNNSGEGIRKCSILKAALL